MKSHFPFSGLAGLGVWMVLALVQGGLYLFLAPAWQHYDEPKHFEYVWFVANRDDWPDLEAYDPKLSRQVIKSMLASGFYDRSAEHPVIGPPSEKVSIPGYSQLDEPPLYYALAALPLRLAAQQSVKVQLYLARLVSLALFLITVVAAWGVGQELCGPAAAELRRVAWMLPLGLILLPAFADLMTAVNNDAGAIAIFSWFVWGSVRLLCRGFSWVRLGWVGVAAVLAVFTKVTAAVALILLPLVVVLALLRPRPRLAWGLLGGMALLGGLLSLSWGDAAAWYRMNSQGTPTRQKNAQAVLGQYVLALDMRAAVTPDWLEPLFQPLPSQVGQGLGGKTVTVGAWMWASRPIAMPSLILNTPSRSFSQPLQVGTTPAFYAFQATLPADAGRTWLQVAHIPAGDQPLFVYLDGLLLAEGAFASDQPPTLAAPDGQSGVWAGRPFTNLLRNPSAEQATLRVRPLVDNLSARYLPDQTRLSLILTALRDWPASGYLFKGSLLRLLYTFWAYFGWGGVGLIGTGLYRVLTWVSMLSMVGAGWGVLRQKWFAAQAAAGGALAFLALCLLLVWGVALSRSVVYLAYPKIFFPVARYAYPAILPTLIFFNLGWLEIWGLLQAAWNWLARRRGNPALALPGQGKWVRFGCFLYVAGMVALDVWAMVSIYVYYA